MTPAQLIIHEVCQQYGMARADIFTNTRRHRVVAMRYHAFYRLRTETKMTFRQIALRCGIVCAPHTVMYGAAIFAARNGLPTPAGLENMAGYKSGRRAAQISGISE